MDTLPVELLGYILQQVDDVDCVAGKFVCKLWRVVIGSRNIANAEYRIRLIKADNAELLRWANDNGLNLGFNVYMLCAAEGAIKTITWVDTVMELYDVNDVMYAAIDNSCLDILKYVSKNYKIEPSVEITKRIIKRGDAAMLAWYSSHVGLVMYTKISNDATNTGNVEICRVLHTIGVRYNIYDWYNTYSSRNIPLAMFLLEVTNIDYTQQIAQYGWLEGLKAIHKKRAMSKSQIDLCLYEAITYHQLDIVKWFYDNGHSYPMEKIEKYLKYSVCVRYIYARNIDKVI